MFVRNALRAAPAGVMRRGAPAATRGFALAKDLSNLGLSAEQVTKIRERDVEYRNQYRNIEASLSPEEADLVKRKRLIYRSKQRGWLEVDLLMGSWAAANVPTLSNQQLDEYNLLLEEETIDIFNYVSGKDPLPPHLENLSIIPIIQKYAFSAQINSPLRYAEVKEKANLT